MAGAEENKLRTEGAEPRAEHSPHSVWSEVAVAAPVAVYRFLVGDEGAVRVLYVSDQIESLCGVSAAEVRRDPRALTARIHPDDVAASEDLFLAAICEGRDFVRDLRVSIADGRWRWLHARAAPMRSREGATIYQGIVADVTRRKEAEEALSREADFNQRVFNSLDSRLAVIGSDGVIEKVNAAWRRFAEDNAPGGEAVWGIGASYFVPFDEAWGDASMAAEAFEGIRQVLRGERAAFSLEYPCNGPGETRRWFSMRVAPLEGPEGSVLVAHTDITAIKRAEEALRETNEMYARFISQSPIYAYIKEVDERESRVLHASENFAEMIGIPGSKMIGRTMRELFPPELAEPMTAADQDVVRGGKVLRTEEELAGRSYASVKFPIALGEKTLLAGYTIDITERQRAEDQRRALERQLLHAQKKDSLGVMAGGIAHQFNNLLTIIQGNLELARGHGNPAVDALLADAESAVQRATAISRSMLSYLGQSAHHREPRNMARDTMDLLPFIRAALPTNVRLEVDIASDLPWCTIDPAELRVVVLNLATNAWGAVAERGGVVRVTVRREGAISATEDPDERPVQRAGPWSCLEVRDDGPGFDAETRERIFDPFFSTKFTGRGLGLPVAQGIVHASGGVIQVESTPPRGTVARVYLPESTPAELASLRPAAVGESLHATAVAPRSGAVLLVDDDNAVLRAGQRLLLRMERDVILASSGVEAIEAFAAHEDSIGCVVLDLSMPGMDGWEVLAELRRRRPDLYVIVASGYDLARLRKERRDVQPDAWLQKPFNATELAALLKPESAARSG